MMSKIERRTIDLQCVHYRNFSLRVKGPAAASFANTRYCVARTAAAPAASSREIGGPRSPGPAGREHPETPRIDGFRINHMEERAMARGDKSSYTSKQRRQARHIEKGLQAPRRLR